MGEPVQADHNRFVIEFAVSGTAAAISKTIASPIQVIKIRLQLQDALLKKGTLEKPYKGIVDCFKRLYQQQGLRAYYKGNLTNAIRYFPTQAFNFAFKDFFARKLNNQQASKDFWKMLFRSMVSGSLAGAASQFFVYPLDYIRTRLTNDIMQAKNRGQKQFKGIVDCMKKTAQSDGIRGLYRGFVVTCVHMMMYRGVYFGLNDSIKHQLSSQILENILLNFLIGYGITVSSGMISYPLDTVRRRMMMSSGQSYRFNSSIDCIKFLYNSQGIKSFYGGVAANIIRGVTGAGVLTIYDKIQMVVFGKKYATKE